MYGALSTQLHAVLLSTLLSTWFSGAHAQNGCNVVQQGQILDSEGMAYPVDFSSGKFVSAQEVLNDTDFSLGGMFCWAEDNCVVVQPGDVFQLAGMVFPYAISQGMEFLSQEDLSDARCSVGCMFCPQHVDKECFSIPEDDVFASNGNYAPDDGSPLQAVKRGAVSSKAGMFCKAISNFDALYELWVFPSWSSFAGFDQARGRLLGSMNIEYEWTYTDMAPFGDFIQGPPPRLLNIANFESGDVQESPKAEANFGKVGGTPWDTIAAYQSLAYTGSFNQFVDGTCAPFNTQKIKFDLRLPSPYYKVVQLKLGCARGDLHCSPRLQCADPWACDHPRNLSIIQHTKFEGEAFEGFEWSAMTCERLSTRHIVCSMDGLQQISKAFVVDLVPGLVMSIIGFASFLIPYTMVMPRVGTTMIALLTFVNKGSSVMSLMPKKGFGIVEEFYITGTIAMLINVLGHVLSFKYPSIALLVNELQFGFTSILFVFMLTTSLHSRSCEHVPIAATSAGIAVTSLLLLLTLLFSIKNHRHDFTEFKRRTMTMLVAEEDGDTLPPVSAQRPVSPEIPSVMREAESPVDAVPERTQEGCDTSSIVSQPEQSTSVASQATDEEERSFGI